MKHKKRWVEKDKISTEIPARPKRGWKAVGRYAAWFFIGTVLASLFWYEYSNAEISSIATQIKPHRQGGNAYQFINPLLGYDLPNSVQEFQEYQPLISQINNVIASESSSAPDAYGVYFRDLTIGRWAGVNENQTFAPGSMMKVALMIAYYKEAENDPSVLDKMLIYSSSTADQLNGIPFETPSDLQVGQSYTVEQLIEAMIKSSDNGAKNALLDNIDAANLSEISTDLGFSYLDVTKDYSSYDISPKQYSLILRALYNATYLSRDYSEKALSILSQAEYNQGLVAGVPSSTIVSQKFGESVSSTLEITLSNCGVIYQANDPYVLCVMTEGKDATALASTIAAISRTAWNTVNDYAAHKAL